MEENANAKDSVWSVIITYLIVFVVMVVAVMIGNELTARYEFWQYCRHHREVVSCVWKW